MAVNSWLNGNNFPQSEQSLLQNLIDEAIQIKGMDVSYLIRTMDNRDFLFGESPISSFKEKATVEMYLADIQNFNGDGDVFGSFGQIMTDTAVFEVSARRFKEEFELSFGLERPREGDLIYMPLEDSLWEVKKVKSDPRFRQLGKNYKYRLVCNLFTYSYEELEDNTPEKDVIDQFVISDDSGLEKILGLRPDNFNDISPQIEKEVVNFNPKDPFGGR